MTSENDELSKRLDAEARAAEETRDKPIPATAQSSRPGHARSSVFSVRLNDDEIEALTAAARAKGIPASTLARSLIVLGLRAGLADGVTGTALDPSVRTAIHEEVQRAVREIITDRDVA